MPEDTIPVPRSLLLDLRLAAAIATAARERRIAAVQQRPRGPSGDKTLAEAEAELDELRAEHARLKAAHWAAFNLLART